MPIVETNGIETYYERNGSGPPLVFVHASILNHRSWEGQVRELSLANETITYDLRGHGRTGPTEAETYTVELLADDLHALIDELGLEDPLVCAHSFGGLVAQRYAGDHGENLAGLVLADAFTPRILTAGERLLRRVLMPSLVPPARLFGYERVEKASVWLADRLFAGSGGAYDRIQQLRAEGPGMATDEVAKTIHAMTHAHEHPIDLTRIDVPTLVVYGEDDLPFVKRQAEHLAVHVPDARIEPIADAGHAAPLERPAAFNAALRGFLEEIGDTKRGRAP
jgi:pimeloyl-ACP methyl ester carboxylesterase